MAKRKQTDSSKKKDDSEKAAAKKQKILTGEVWSKSKKKRMRQRKAKQTKADSQDKNVVSKKNKSVDKVDNTKSVKQQPLPSSSGTATEPSDLQKSFMARLTGSRFRELNEELYTTTSDSAFQRFSENPQLYEQYHNGFRHQVEQWPVNPVNVIAKWLITNFRKQSPCIVADFGCGDAQLAQKLLETRNKNKCPFQVHSFDLVACSDLVTACDMANVPLDSKSVNVAVFCLSLMGTNLADFLREAHRVLADAGVLKIAEVRSRFESSSNRDELQDFIQVLDKLGFKCTNTDRSNTMFVLLECKKNGKTPQPDLCFSAKPCIYKRR